MENYKKLSGFCALPLLASLLVTASLRFQGKKAWIDWIHQLTGVEIGTATILLTLIGFMDLLVALIVLVRPMRIALLWAAFWGFWTALVRPLVGEPIWDFVERWQTGARH